MKKYLLLCLSMLLACVNDPEEKTDDCTMSNPENGIEIVSPKAGDSFMYGDTVNLKFKVNTALVQGIRVQGKNGANIFDKAISFEPEPQFQCADTTWVTGSEAVPVDYAELDTITLILSDYTRPYICDTVKIVIQNPITHNFTLGSSTIEISTTYIMKFDPGFKPFSKLTDSLEVSEVSQQ